MSDKEKVFEALRMCISDEPKCKECPCNERCEQVGKGITQFMPVQKILLLDVVNVLKDALTEQGRKVKARRDGENGVWCCGACGHPVFPSLLEKYCPGCGKAVDYDA